MNETAIAWTKVTWNPASGCEIVSEGCKYCYAKTLAESYRGAAFPNGFGLTIRPHKLNEPRKLKEPSLIFVNSMSDLFWEEIPMSYRDQVVDVIESTPEHQYQVLTKRPQNMLAYSKRRKLPKNFWAGTTVESFRVEERIDILRQVKAETRFLSVEPLLTELRDSFKGIDWVITGGESGLHLRDPAVCEKRALVHHGSWELRDDRREWLRSIRDRCVKRGVAYFHKQHGGVRPESGGSLLDGMEWKQFPPAGLAVLHNKKLSRLQSEPTTLPLFAKR